MNTLVTFISHDNLKPMTIIGKIRFRSLHACMDYNKFKLDLFYNDYETISTTYINHARWHRCLRSDGLRVGGNRSTKRKPTSLTW